MSDIKAEPWFDSKGHMDEDEPATPAEVEALKLFLAGELSIDAAARSIMSMDESQVSLEDKDFRLAWFLFEAKIRFVDRQDDILNLEDAIANIPDEELALTEGQKARYPDWSEWKKLDPCPGPMDSMRRCAYSSLAQNMRNALTRLYQHTGRTNTPSGMMTTIPDFASITGAT